MRKYFDEKLNDEVYYVSDIIYPTKVLPMEDYKLLVDFSTGEKKVFDVSPLLNSSSFKPLQNKGIFNSAKIAFGTVVWNDDIDLCPESLYRDSCPYNDM